MASKAKAAKKKEEEKKVDEKKIEEKKEEPKPAESAKETEKKDEPETTKKRAGRATSNVFALFPQSQIQEFKEAFTLIDQNRDGIIDVDDLRAMFGLLGMEPDKKYLQEMVDESPGQLNFTMFLSLFGDKLHGTDPEDAIRNAFAMFDPDQKGYLTEEYLKDLLTNMGDNFTQTELKQMWKDAPSVCENEKFDYNKYVTLIKRGNQEELNKNV